MKPGDLVQTKEQWGHLTLFDKLDCWDIDSKSVTNLKHDQPVLVIAIVNNQALVMVPRRGGAVYFGWREVDNFRVVNEAG